MNRWIPLQKQVTLVLIFLIQVALPPLALTAWMTVRLLIVNRPSCYDCHILSIQRDVEKGERGQTEQRACHEAKAAAEDK